MCIVCVKSSPSAAAVYKAHHDTIEDHAVDGGEDQSLERFLVSNDGAEGTRI